MKVKKNYRNSQNVPIKIHPYNKFEKKKPTILKRGDTSLQIAFAHLYNRCFAAPKQRLARYFKDCIERND